MVAAAAAAPHARPDNDRSGDLTDDEALPNMGDAMIGAVTAHFYSAAHASALNAAFTDAYRKEAKDGANFMAVSGYDGMHAIYEALKKTNGSADGKALIAAMRGMSSLPAPPAPR